MVTPQDKAVALQVLKAIAETIQEAKDGAPLGPMYMALNSRGMSLDTFNGIINEMKGLGLIEVRHHCAFWIAGRVQ